MEADNGALPMEAEKGALLPASHGGSMKQYAKQSRLSMSKACNILFLWVQQVCGQGIHC